MTGQQEQQNTGEELRQSDIAQVHGPMREVINLPGHGDRLHLRRGRGQKAGKNKETEIRIPERYGGCYFNGEHSWLECPLLRRRPMFPKLPCALKSILRAGLLGLLGIQVVYLAAQLNGLPLQPGVEIHVVGAADHFVQPALPRLPRHGLASMQQASVPGSPPALSPTRNY